MSSFRRMSRYSCISLLLASSVVFAAKDPTRPPSKLIQQSSERIASSFKVDSIIIGNDRKLAVINGKRAVIGELVGGARVADIDAGSVLLFVDDVYKRVAISKPLQKKWIKREKR